ncbi:MAG TPA: 6-pyruvoyl-tetrahydropterin synthase-related protein, partial [Patescibacteria group bacterium]|nr:6-pyruvoyl-tetrahydropterin synthase-related protein [Patescibacteria group bacterium]
IPQWIKSHCSGYGCPSYLFLFMLPYYIISLFHFAGVSFLFSTKLTIIISFILSGIGMYFWMKDEFGKVSGFVAAIFYLFAPYHLIDLSFRVSIGELTSMAILPFSFLASKKYLETKKLRFFLLNALLLALLILSHQVTSFACFPLLLLYSLAVWYRNKKRKIKDLLLNLSSLLVGVLLTMFYWLPIMLEGKLTKYGQGVEIDFHPITSFLYSPNRFGLLFQGHHGELYFNVGYVQWILIAACIYLFFRKKLPSKDKIMLGGSLALFAIFFIMMQSITKPIWDITPIIKGFEFAWRLMIEITVFISIMVAIIVKLFPNKKFVTILCILTIGYTLLNWGNRKVIPSINDTVLRNQPVFTEHPGKWGIDFTSPIWVDEYKPWIGIVPKNHIDILAGQAKIVQIERLTIKHEYVISALTDVRLKENTYYYPGWQITANNHPVPITYQDKTYPGIMIFNLKKGLYKVDVIFTDTWDRKLGKVISLLTFFVLICHVFYHIRFKKRFFRS